MRPVVAVIGASAPEPHLVELAHDVGIGLARAGIVVCCGGLGGVMAAVCRGAHSADGITVGVLPGDDPGAANPDVDIALPTGLGEARNVVVARAGRAVIAIGGGYGTLSELAFARRAGVPVIGLRTWQLPGLEVARVDTAADAVRHAVAIATGSLEQ